MDLGDDAPNLCPLDERRTATEVFVKRMAVMFGVLCLLANLNARRGIASPPYLPRAAASVFLTIFNPLYPAIALLSDGLWALARAFSDARRRYAFLGGPSIASTITTGDLNFYLAAAAGAHASHREAGSHDPGGRVATSTALLHLPPETVRTERRRRPAGIHHLGGLLVLLAGAVQCGATAYLGFRREVRDAATPLDRRQYLFAASGLAVLAQTLVLRALGTPRYAVDGDPGRAGDPRWAHARLSGVLVVVEAVMYVGSLCLASYYAGDGVNEIALIAVAWFGAAMLFWPWHLLWQEDIMELPQMMKSTLEGELLPSLRKLLTPRRYWAARKKVFAELGDGLTTMAMAIGLCLMHLIPLIFGGCAAYLYFLVTYAPASDHFADDQGNPMPTDIPCPELWKDPMADLLWAF